MHILCSAIIIDGIGRRTRTMKDASIAAMFTARAVSAFFGSPAWRVPQSKEPPKIQVRAERKHVKNSMWAEF
jgi:hypothetical protein